MGAEMGADFEVDEEEQQTSSKDKSPAVASTTATTTAGASTSAPAPAPAAAPAAAAKPSQPAAEGPSGAAFQDTIRRTMERMQSSGDQATAAAAAGGEDDFLAEMLKQLTAGEFAGGSEEDFSKMLMGMMEQLTNKEILYEPMKELHDKFPAWLAKNKDSVPADDLKRYMEQKTIVEEIVAKFNEPTYSDSNAKDREYIVDRMQRVSLDFFTAILVTMRLTNYRCKRQDRRRQTWLVIWPLPRKPLMAQKTSALRNKLLTCSRGAPILYTRTFIHIPIVRNLNASTFHHRSNACERLFRESRDDYQNSISPIDKRLDHSTLLDKMTLTQLINQYPSGLKLVKIAAAAVKTVSLLR